MFDTLAQIVLESIKAWNSHEKTKLRDRTLELQKEYYAESNKPIWDGTSDPDPAIYRSDRKLDLFERELCLIAHAVTSGLREQNP